MAPLLPAPNWSHPDSDWLADAARPDGGSPASDPALLDEDLAARGVERAILCADQAILAGALPHTGYSLDLVRALNDWTRERWLSRSSRLYGLIMVASQVPEAAVAEIQRMASEPRMVGVLLAGNGLGRPFGHPAYHSIYAAAAELGLPVVLHVGTESPPNTASHPTAGGYPSTFGELHVLRAQPLMTHLMSLIAQGVLERHPGLRVVAVGAGMAWLPAWLWRFDSDYKAYSARETPWLRRFPSEQVVEQIAVTTYSAGAVLEQPGFERLLRTAEWLRRCLCFASGYPRWDADAPDAVAGTFPAEWRGAIMRDTALGLFRWPDRPGG
jgi:predicted TIM-barrel fold metal-dependent hydrolase